MLISAEISAHPENKGKINEQYHIYKTRSALNIYQSLLRSVWLFSRPDVLFATLTIRFVL